MRLQLFSLLLIAALASQPDSWDVDISTFLKKIQEGKQAREAGGREPDGWWLKTCAGWSSLMLCSAIFGAGISEEVARAEDVGELFGSAADAQVDYNRRAVDTLCLWDVTGSTVRYTAIWRQGIGCTLVEGLTEAQLRAQNIGNQQPQPPLDPFVPWPRGEGPPISEPPPGIDMQCLRDTVEAQFADREANPRAITVVFREQLIFERYAPTVNRNTRLLGWSATKSVVNALIGIVVGQGRLEPSARAPVPEWADDNRSDITLDQMLHMTSGTFWGFDPLTSTDCLFASDGNCAHYCAREYPLLTPPGSRYEYNSGSTYILSRIVNEFRGDRELVNHEWHKRRLFNPIGAYSFYIEHQPNGHFLGGALGYATARDWARFGLLFLRNGVWIDGTRVVPEGWVHYSTRGSTADPGYGAHWRLGRNVEQSLFYATGFRNQNVYVFPNLNLVVTRNAMPQPLQLSWNQNEFLRGVLSCITREANATNGGEDAFDR